MRPILKKIVDVVTNRVFLLSVFILILFSILITRLFYLQIIHGEHYKNLFETSIQKEVSVEGMRGDIYDRYGRLLAKNDYVYSILYESSFNMNDIDLNKMLFDLINIIESNGEQIINEIPIGYSEEEGFYYLEWYSENQILRFKKDIFITNELNEEQINMSAQQLYDYLCSESFFNIASIFSVEESLKIIAVRYEIFMNRYQQYKPVAIAKDVNESTIVKIKEHQENYPGVNISTDIIRIYPYGEALSHIVGYTGRITEPQLQELEPLGYDQFDIVGRTGIEKEMEVYLKGKDGKKVYDVDNTGKIISENMVVNPTQGDNIYLTIDAQLQQELYNILEDKITDILLDKIVLTKKDDTDILLSEVFFSMINNYFLKVDNLNNQSLPHSYKLYRLYDDYSTSFINQYKELLYSSSIQIKSYNEVMKDFYISMTQYMIDKGILDTQYRNDNEFYSKYKNYETTAFEFFTYCYNNNLINLEHYNINTQVQSSYEVVSNIVEIEFNNFIKREAFKFRVYDYIINNGLINYRDLTLILYEQGLIKGTESEIQSVTSGVIHPLVIIEEKLANGDITPHDLGLDPSTGSIVLADVKTGEVISMVSYPSYDNNKLVNNFDNEYYQQLVMDKTYPLYHRPTKERTAPGSTFKMVTAMAALEENVVEPYEEIYSLGTFDKIPPPHPSCWSVSYGYVHGPTDISRGLEVSCNYFYYEMGYRLGSLSSNQFSDVLGIKMLQEYAHKFGLDAPSGVELDESKPSVSDKDAVRTSIGQGNNAFTPSQIARYIVSLANGGTTYDLTLLDKVITQEGAIVEDNEPKIYYQNNFKQENLDVIYEGMNEVTAGSSGTARAVFTDFPIEVAGKTGTAQQVKTRPDHALFAGFAPYNDPQIAVSVVIPFGYTSNYATELFKDVVATYFDIYKEEKQGINDNELIY